MKSTTIFLEKPGCLSYREQQLPDPGRDEVQLKSLVNGICMAEISLYSGVLHAPPYPRPLGHEGLGIVMKVGSAVTGISEGDIVTFWNDPRFDDGIGFTWSNRLNVLSSRLIRLSGLPTDPAFFMAEPVACVVNALTKYQLSPGDDVLLIGAGYMGLLNIQGLAGYPLAGLTVVDINKENLVLAEKWGADEIIDVSDKSGIERLNELREQHSFDLVIEAAGVEQTLINAGELVRSGGRLAMFAWHHGNRNLVLDDWHIKGIEITNCSPYSGIDSNLNIMKRAVSLMEKGTFFQEELVTHRWNFDEAEQALESIINSRPEGFRKGVLIFDL